MTPRQRILAVLEGKKPDRVPFTIKRPQPAQSTVERNLRNDGLAICGEEMVFSTIRPQVEVFKHEYLKNGRDYMRETFRTPVGEVDQVWVKSSGGYGSDKLDEYLIKKPQDYKVVDFMIRDEVYTPAYDEFARAEEVLGEDGFLFAGWMPPTPLMQMLWELMGIEKFTIDYFEFTDTFFALYETLFERQREQYRMVAAGPAHVAHIEENMTGDMIGRERFEKYVVPCYNEFASILHEKGKLLAAHFDGRMKILAEALANSQMDIIEAFCPVPDGDLEMAEARRIWKDKIVWINFPSPVHLWEPQEIKAYTRKILREVAPGDKFLLGITEDVPDKVWQISLPIIAKVLQEEAALPLLSEGEKTCG